MLAIRYALVCGILVFIVTIGKSQNTNTIPDSEKPKNAHTEKVQPASNPQPISNLQTKKTITSDIVLKKMGEHAPDPYDADFEARKAEWINNYPEEYKAYIEKSANFCKGANNGIATEVKQSATTNPQKMAEHAPILNDPNYDTKKVEWMKNYPQEYNQLINPSSDFKNTSSDVKENK